MGKLGREAAHTIVRGATALTVFTGAREARQAIALPGLGFASALSGPRALADNFLLSLLAFNIGIELGQLTVIAGAFLLTLALLRKPWYWPRIALPASVAIALLAAVWMVPRPMFQAGG